MNDCVTQDTHKVLTTAGPLCAAHAADGAHEREKDAVSTTLNDASELQAVCALGVLTCAAHAADSAHEEKGGGGNP